MKSIMLCSRMPHDNSYVGGVVSILLAYLNNEDKFHKNGYDLKIFSYQLSRKWSGKNSKIQNIVYIFLQRKALSKKLKEDSDLVLNIHTSREFLFLKDIMLARMAAKKYKVPVVMSIHVGDLNTVFNRIYPMKKRIIKWMNKYILKVVFLSDEMRKQFIEEGLVSSRCEVLYNFHNMDLITECDIIPKTSKLHLLFAGAIHREKGILELLSALNSLNDIDFHLDICGKMTDKSIESEFNNLVSKLGNKVTLRGYVSGKNKTALFERADVLILPSYHEGMPLVILEGMCQGCALISTKVGSTPEILDENNVIWIGVKSSGDLERAIRKLYESPDILRNMQQANKALSYNYTIERNINKLCMICSEVEE